MERLTERIGSVVINVKYATQHETAIHRLAAIEDILGDEYDLDRLREMVELTKNIPHVCRFCVGCEMEPKDGHGCDKYDSFVFSTRRLRELVQSDRDGRCVVLPCKKGDTVWRIVHDAAPHITKDRCTDIKYENRDIWVHLIGDRVMGGWNFGKLLFLTRAEAEQALRREQDGNNK